MSKMLDGVDGWVSGWILDTPYCYVYKSTCVANKEVISYLVQALT